MRNKILSDIMNETLEQEKLQKIVEFKNYMKNVTLERAADSFEFKLKDIK
jgi:hypothetical protein